MLPIRSVALIEQAYLPGLPIESLENPAYSRTFKGVPIRLRPDHPGASDCACHKAIACWHRGEQGDMASMYIDESNRLAIVGPVPWLRPHGVRASTDLIVIGRAIVLRIGRKVSISQIQGELADQDLPPCLLHR